MSKTTVDHRNLMLLRINRYVEVTRKDPVILRSPFTGEIIFVQKPLEDLIKGKEMTA